MKYKFYCTFLGVQTEVFPVNFKSATKFVWEQEGDEIFMRKKLDGQLLFKNTPIDSNYDFDYFYEIELGADRCEEISFLVRRSCDNGSTYTDYWKGYFSINEGTFEPDSCLFSIKINPDDKYRCYIEGTEQEYNINKVENEISTNVTITSNYEFYTCRDTESNCNAGRPAPAATWLVFHTEVIDGVTTTIYYRETAITACQSSEAERPTGSGWFQVVSYGDCENGLAKWARTPLNVVVNNPNPDVSAGSCEDVGPELVPTPPPRKRTLAVTKNVSTPTPIIVGLDVVDLSNCSTGVIWKVKDNPGSTYVWSITGSGNTITSGGATAEVTCDLNNVGTIKVIETTTCGASAQASLAFSNGGIQSIANFEIDSRIKVCYGSVSQIKINYPTGRSLSFSSSPAGCSITQIDAYTWELTVGVVAGTVQFLWTGGGGCSVLAPPIPPNITVGKNIETPEINGLTDVCGSGASKYFVPALSSASYEWSVLGGTITSGQGTNEITVSWSGILAGNIELKEQVCDCGWVLISPCGNSGEPSYWWCPDVDVTITKTKLLKDVLDYLATQICGCHSCEMGYNSVRSDFFNINPVGDSPGFVDGFNYVTGEVQKLTYLSLTPKEIILEPTSLANKGILSWKIITEMLRDIFQVYWFVDDNYNVRFEHIVYFQRTVRYDTLSPQYIKYRKRTKYTYDKFKMPKYERFSWMEATNTDFVGAEISYNSICVNQDSRTNVTKLDVSKVTTDIILIGQSPSDISKDGFVMLVNDLNGDTYNVSIEEGLITETPIANAHLSWANLHYNYWRYNRVLLGGSMNIRETNFLTTKRFKRQEEVTFPFCCNDDLEPLEDLIVTSLGNGVVDKAVLNNHNNMIVLSLLFP